MKAKTIVSASDVGKAAFCAHSLSLDKKYKLSNRAETKEMLFGVKKHEALTSEVIQGDRRCFVSSHTYGEDHVVTAHLRAWRDSRLKPRWWGRALVNTYYFLSPVVIGFTPVGSPIFVGAKRSVYWLYRITGGKA